MAMPAVSCSSARVLMAAVYDTSFAAAGSLGASGGALERAALNHLSGTRPSRPPGTGPLVVVHFTPGLDQASGPGITHPHGHQVALAGPGRQDRPEFPEREVHGSPPGGPRAQEVPGRADLDG